MNTFLRCLFALLSLGAAAPSIAVVLVVDADGSATVNDCGAAAEADAQTIQMAIDLGSPGDKILVCPGTYAEDLTIHTDDLILEGVDRETTTIEGVATNPEAAFPEALPNIDWQASGVQLRNFTIQSPASEAGAYASGIVIDGTDNTIRDNHFKVSAGDPGTVAIQTWVQGSQGIQDISGLKITRNTFASLEPGNAFGYEAVFINPQLGPADAENSISISRNEFSGQMYRAVGIARPYTDVRHNILSTDLPLDDVPIFGGAVPLGIKLFDGDEHSLVRNAVTGMGGGAFAVGLTINPESQANQVVINYIQGEAAVVVSSDNNKLVANYIEGDVAVVLSSDDNNLINNWVKADGGTGIELVDADENKLVNNKLVCLAAGTGIVIDAGSDANKLINNRFTGCDPDISDDGTGTIIRPRRR